MKAKKNNFRQYLWSLSFVFLILLVISATINYVVDPYGFFDSKRINGFNQLKPKATLRVRITKPHLVDVINPRTIIAGNSRPEIGLNPQNSCWPESYHPVFNLSLPGSSVYMMLRYIQHAIAGNEVGQVLWGLDFKDFLNDATGSDDMGVWPPVTESYEDRLRVNADGSNNDNHYWNQIKDHLTFLFSLDALTDSFITISRQPNQHTPTIRRDGYNPAEDFLDIIALEGQGLIFKQVNINTAVMFNKPSRTLFTNRSDKSLQFESVRQLLTFAQKNDVNVVLFINPYHSDYLSSIHLAGLWDQFLLWKKKLTYLASEFDVPLWDFSGFNELSNAQPPVIGDYKNILRWFWEPAHYRREYGDLMLSQMLNRACDNSDIAYSGQVLKPENLDDYFINSNNSLNHYRNVHVAAIKRLRQLYPVKK